jgi:hypothetical protein
MGRRSRPLWCRTRGRLAWTATAVSRDTGQPGRRGSQVAGEPVSWEPQRQPWQQPELATGMIGTAAPTTGRRATAGDRPQRNNRSQRNNRLDRTTGRSARPGRRQDLVESLQPVGSHELSGSQDPRGSHTRPQCNNRPQGRNMRGYT